MVRNFKAKTSRGKDSNLVRRAARVVLEDNTSVQSAAKSFGVSFSTLNRLVNRRKVNILLKA